MRNPRLKQRHQPSTPQFLTIAHLILPWLTPQELSIISSVNTTLHRLSKLITTARSSDATRSLQTHPIPFINTLDSHPYAYFLYTPTQLAHPNFFRQFWDPNLNSQFHFWGIYGDCPNPKPNSQQLRGFAPNTNPNSKFDLGNRGIAGIGGDSNCSATDSSRQFRGFPPNPNSSFDLSCGFGRIGCDCGEKCEVDDGCDCCILGYGDGAQVVTECGPSCLCKSSCGNRVTQKGVSIRFKIVRVANKGWGLFTDQFVSSGKFVCEYAGELLTTQEARRRQQSYDELAKGGKFYSALLVVREYLPSRKACFRINIDATTIGNVARFINHSCDGGNLTTVLVRSSGSVIPRVCFFTTRDVQAGEELSFSYGDVGQRPQGLSCCCGSPSCFGILPSEPT